MAEFRITAVLSIRARARARAFSNFPAISCGLLAMSLYLIVLIGCAPKPPAVITSPAPVQPPAFPPQQVMESGDYAGFFAENRTALLECNDKDKPCDVPLFNLGFTHAYPGSPYYNKGKGLQYFEALTRNCPQSPLTFQARAWADLLKKVMESEDKQRRLKGELKSKDATIGDLQEQIRRSRDIDLQVEQKERELLK